MQKEQAVNVTWIGVAGSLGFVAGIIIGIIMAAAIVNRRKFRWYDLCFPQSDNHGNEKGANGMLCTPLEPLAICTCTCRLTL